MARVATITLALLVALGLAVPSAAAATRPAPKVVLIVGPVGDLTDRYRALADAAAEAASAFTPRVVKVYSPNATWSKVRRALQGASIVVYLGHGNGWPSKYRDSLFPVTQNGFGLNPTAGGGDHGHQYFGEASIARDVKLARHAVVVLSHLCYASGNTEPGLPEGAVADAKRRIDNYAAGFIAAGASAVIAEGHFGPAWYVRSLLSSNEPVERLWRSAPSAHGNAVAFTSLRSNGFVGIMDPDLPRSGFYRSIVLRGGLRSAQLAAGAASLAGVALPADPTLVGTGITLGIPALQNRPAAASKTALTIPIKVPKSTKAPKLTVGVRWDPIDVPDTVPIATEGAGTTGTEAPTADSARPGTGTSATPTSTPTPKAKATPKGTSNTTKGTSTAAPTEPGVEPVAEPRNVDGRPTERAPDAESTPQPAVDPRDPSLGDVQLVQPEELGSLVQPAAATLGGGKLKVQVKLPDRPGRYRLVITLHDRTGLAFDAATQEMVRGLLVRVTGPNDAQYLVSATKAATAGEPFRLPVGVANLGSSPWGNAPSASRRAGEARPATHAVLVARWVALGTAATTQPRAVAAPDMTLELPPGLAPGDVARGIVVGTAPAASGDYLVMLDVVTPELGSLAAKGVSPGLVRVTVTNGS